MICRCQEQSLEFCTVFGRCQEQLLAVWTSTLSLVKQRVYNYCNGSLHGADAKPLCVLNPEQRLEVDDCLDVMSSLLVPPEQQSTDALCRAAETWKADLKKMKGTAKGVSNLRAHSDGAN